LLELFETGLETDLDCGDVRGCLFQEGVKLMLNLTVDGPIILP
jgi:hypothetical protein